MPIRSEAVARITVAVHTREVRRRNYISQPEPLAVRDQMRCKLEQRQLALLHSIVRGNRAAVAARSKDMANANFVELCSALIEAE